MSSENGDWDSVSWLAPGISITAVARAAAGVPVVANGGLHDPATAAILIRDSHADLIALGKGALANPDWPRRVRDGRTLEPYDRDMLWPEVTLANTARWRGGPVMQGASAHGGLRKLLGWTRVPPRSHPPNRGARRTQRTPSEAARHRRCAGCRRYLAVGRTGRGRPDGRWTRELTRSESHPA